MIRLIEVTIKKVEIVKINILVAYHELLNCCAPKMSTANY